MTLSELRTLTRQRLRDTVKPYFVSDLEIDAYLNEAEREACERALLIEDHDSFTIDLTTTDTRYPIDPRIIDVIDITIGTEIQRPFTDGWTLTETHLILDHLPTVADVLTLHCYRLPTRDMGDSDEPEIRAVHHFQLTDWALHRCYLIPDSELFNPDASARSLGAFIQSFGERPSALVRRNQRSKTPRRVAYNGAI